MAPDSAAEHIENEKIDGHPQVETHSPATEEPDDAGPSVAELEVRLAEVEDRWRRSAADLDNVQKRFQRELDRGRTAERERIMAKWLDTVDDLERALSHSGPDETLLEWVAAIATHAVSAIELLGYPRVGEPGELFDPEIHDALSTISSTAEHPPNTVVAVIKPGYGTKEHMLRPAAVVVAKDQTQ